jgi:hypothetical protein
MLALIAWMRYKVFDEDNDVAKGQVIDWIKVVE